MDTVANYIVRIYRCEKDRPKSLVGVVVEAGEKEKKVFQGYDELWEILSNLPGGKVHKDETTGSSEGGDHLKNRGAEEKRGFKPKTGK